jgi:3-dehydroquinate dehydratase-2
MAMTMKILLLSGPNLNLLGEREPEIYGALTLKQLEKKAAAYARSKGASLKALQSNSEGRLIDILHAHRKTVQGVVFNPGAYSHYSYALRDAVAAIRVPVIEVHLSDITKREPFRRVSVVAPACAGTRYGRGADSYLEAIDDLLRLPR